MADGLKCPTMRWETGNDQEALQEFRVRLERWFIIKDVDKTKQHHYIIFQAGEKAEESAKTWTLTQEDLNDPNNVWDQLQQSVGLADNFRIHRLTLETLIQRPDEPIDEFYTRIRGIAMKCKFGSDMNNKLIDQVIKGTKCLGRQKRNSR